MKKLELVQNKHFLSLKLCMLLADRNLNNQNTISFLLKFQMGEFYLIFFSTLLELHSFYFQHSSYMLMHFLLEGYSSRIKSNHHSQKSTLQEIFQLFSLELFLLFEVQESQAIIYHQFFEAKRQSPMFFITSSKLRKVINEQTSVQGQSSLKTFVFDMREKKKI